MKIMKRFFSWLYPLPKPAPIPVWVGVCDCCKREIKSFEQVFPDGSKVECLSCLCGFSEAGKKRREEQKKREEERRQIDLYKQAIMEVENEKHASNYKQKA